MMDLGDFFSIASALTMGIAVLGYLLAVIHEEERYERLANVNLWFSFIFINLASITLIYYLYTMDFQVLYVASHTDRSLPLFYRLSAFYAGAEGSLLLWVWIAMFYAVSMNLLDRKDRLSNLAKAIYLMNSLFLLVLMILASNPFVRLDFVPPDGLGLNPLLQDVGMVMHPPLLFIGYAGLAIPFSYAIAGLILRNERWVFRIRRWLIFSWIFLSQGILFGAWWSYRVLGWGGYWAWDPVENASLLPWLTATALLHSVMIQEARRGLKTWNTLLSIFTFEFVILGTFMTRSGVIASVHAFGQSEVGHHFLVYIVLTLFASIALVIWRYEYLMETSIDIFEAPFSKEMTFLLNNILFMVAATTIFWGTWFPMIHEAVVGTKVRVGPMYYDTIIGPMIWLLILLMGICTAIPWRRASVSGLKDKLKIPALISLVVTLAAYILGYRRPEVFTTVYITVLAITVTVYDFINEYVKFNVDNPVRRFFKLILYKRRKYGGYLIHIAMFLIVFGLLGTQFYMDSYSIKLKPGESYDLGDYIITFNGIDNYREEGKIVWTANIAVYKGGKLVDVMQPKLEKFIKNDQVTPRVDTYMIPEIIGDLYIVFEFLSEDGTASFKVEIMPLVKLLWYSGYILLLGGIVALMPRRVVEKI